MVKIFLKNKSKSIFVKDRKNDVYETERKLGILFSKYIVIIKSKEKYQG